MVRTSSLTPGWGWGATRAEPQAGQPQVPIVFLKGLSSSDAVTPSPCCCLFLQSPLSRHIPGGPPPSPSPAAMSTSSLRRQMKNIVHNYSEAEIKVREATSNDPWGPSSSLMSEIADLTYNVVAFSEIMSMIWKRLNDHGKNWRHVYKVSARACSPALTCTRAPGRAGVCAGFRWGCARGLGVLGVYVNLSPSRPPFHLTKAANG